MPRYFFEMQDGAEKLHDADGTVCASPDEARDAMIVILCDLATETLPDGDHHVFSSMLRDETGRELYSASLTLSGRWLDCKV